MANIKRFSRALLLSFLIFTVQSKAETLSTPGGSVILTVSGSISNTNGDGQARFDEAMLRALGQSTITTSTTWTEGKPVFTGVLGRDLLKAVGATGQNIQAIAINDYKVIIPIADFQKYDVLLATTMDGKKLSRRDKGPIWVIYPRDTNKELRNETTDTKSIWQLVKIIVE